MMLIDQATSSPSRDPPSSSLHMDCFISKTTLAVPDSPTFRVFDEDDMICESNSLSDLALNLSAPYLRSTSHSLKSTKQKDVEEEGGGDCEEDISLVLARNNLSASFSQWEFDPEDGSFHNSSHLIFPDSSEISEPEKKQVHFMADPSDTKLIFCKKYDSPIALTDEDIAAGWYKASEFKRFRRHMHKDARALRGLTSSAYMDKFLELHRSCGKSVQVTNNRSLVSLASFVSSSPYRGQETLIFYEIFHADRKRMSNELLAAQAACRSSIGATELSEMLGSVSKVLSRRSRRVAYTTGLGDAEIAKKQISSKESEFIMRSTGNWFPSEKRREKISTMDESNSEDESGHIEI